MELVVDANSLKRGEKGGEERGEHNHDGKLRERGIFRNAQSAPLMVIPLSLSLFFGIASPSAPHVPFCFFSCSLWCEGKEKHKTHGRQEREESHTLSFTHFCLSSFHSFLLFSFIFSNTKIASLLPSSHRRRRVATQSNPSHASAGTS